MNLVRQRWRDHRLWLAMAVCGLWVAVPALAHKLAPSRSLVIQVDDEGAALLWELNAVGAESSVLRQSWDLDRDGTLSGAESAGLALVLLRKAGQGVSVTWDGSALEPVGLDPRLNLGTAGSRVLTVMGLAKAKLPSSQPGEQHVLRIALAKATGPVALTVQSQGTWRVIGSSRGTLAADAQGIVGVTQMNAGETLDVTFARAATSSPGAGQPAK